MGEATRGLVALVVACTVWGLSPVYYAEVAHVPPLTVLAYRTLWSLCFFLIVLGVQGRLSEVRTPFAGWRRTGMMVLAGLLVSVNWFGFIYAVTSGQTVEASLGYFIFPLVAVALGRIVLGERLAMVQWAAVALATAAVGVLTVGLGAAPWIAIHLAVSFGLYGLVKKRIALGPVLSVMAEVLLLAPLAVVWIALHGEAWDLGLADPSASGGVRGADGGAAGFVFLCGAAGAAVDAGAWPIHQSVAAVPDRGPVVCRAVHPVARDRVPDDLGGVDPVFRKPDRSGQGGAEKGFERGDVGHHRREPLKRRVGEALGHDMGDERVERLPVAGGVEQEDGFGMQAKLTPGQRLEKFVERACATG